MNDETKKGHTPLHIAAQNGHVDIINEFARHNVNLRMVSCFFGYFRAYVRVVKRKLVFRAHTFLERTFLLERKLIWRRLRLK